MSQDIIASTNTRGVFVDPNEVLTQFHDESLKGTNCLLINMPIREQARPNNAPLGLCLLGAQLKKYGAHVEILDLNAYRINDDDAQERNLAYGRVLTESEASALVAKYVIPTEFHLVALSGLITTLKWQKQVVTFIKDLSPKSFIVSGGGLATEFRDDLVNWLPNLDGIAHSEGDSVVVKIAADARRLYGKNTHSYSELEGVVSPSRIFSRNDKLYVSYDGGRPDDLDEIPLPAWELLEKDRSGRNILDQYLEAPIWGKNARNSSATNFEMNRSLNTVSSRGCPFACKFCFRGAQGERNYGVRSAKNLLTEIEIYQRKYNIDFLGFVDDNFAVSRKRILEMEEIFKDFSEKNSTTWGTHCRLDEAADIKTAQGEKIIFHAPLRVKSMYAAGCRYIGFGAESASPRMLRRMGKGGSMLAHGTQKVFGYDVPLTMMYGIINTIDAGIHANCTWIMGYPGETLDDLKATVAFIKWQEHIVAESYSIGSKKRSLAEDAINKNMFVATAYPGTEMFSDPQVVRVLEQGFNIKFEGKSVAVDENLEKYVEQLNDATDLIYTPEGKLVNYSELSDELFLHVRNLIESGDVYEILDLQD